MNAQELADEIATIGQYLDERGFKLSYHSASPIFQAPLWQARIEATKEGFTITIPAPDEAMTIVMRMQLGIFGKPRGGDKDDKPTLS